MVVMSIATDRMHHTMQLVMCHLMVCPAKHAATPAMMMLALVVSTMMAMMIANADSWTDRHTHTPNGHIVRASLLEESAGWEASSTDQGRRVL